TRGCNSVTVGRILLWRARSRVPRARGDERAECRALGSMRPLAAARLAPRAAGSFSTYSRGSPDWGGARAFVLARADQPVAQMPRQKLDDVLEQLVHAELIFRRGTPPDAEYTFKHALVQDAAYSTLLHSRRHQLHGHIVATLESRFPEIGAAEPAILAQ